MPEEFQNIDEVSYLIKFKDQILDEDEKALFIRDDDKSEDINIAKMLLLRGSDLKNVKIHEFRKYMKNDAILDYCAKIFYDMTVQTQKSTAFQHELSMPAIKELLLTIDKYLFIMFRDQVITLDQLKARLAEKNVDVQYVVLDDLRD